MDYTLGTFTPYSTVMPLVDEEPLWAPTLERERIAAYQKYEELYWNNPTAFKLFFRGEDSQPIYIPNPRQIVDTTAHFVMKGFQLRPITSAPRLSAAMEKLFKREAFYSRFHEAKHSGVVRGDYLFHLRANSQKPEGRRISLTSVDPASYFPYWDEDDPDVLLGVDLVEQLLTERGDTQIKRQRYRYVTVDGRRRVESSLIIFETADWWDSDKQRKVKVVREPFLLPARIQTIPVYSFRNIGWQGHSFGASELKGFERIFASINQSASDEEVALALEGLGVYATDAPAPTDESGNELDWVVAPGKVMEIPSGTKFERVQGVGSVKPMQDHIRFLTESLFDASGTFRPSLVDVQVAQSGVALAIKFLPTLAKIELREEEATGTLQQMFWDWQQWHFEYEGEKLEEVELEVIPGEKLPSSSNEILNQLNNMLDRGVISRKYYREQMTLRFGYEFPEGIDSEVLEEIKARQAIGANPDQEEGNGTEGVSDQSGVKNRNFDRSKKRQNRSNNKNRPNESGGSEAK